MQKIEKNGNRYFHFLMLMFLPFSFCTLFIAHLDANSLNNQGAEYTYDAHIIAGTKITKRKKSIETSGYVQNIRSLTFHVKNHFAVNSDNINSNLRYIQPEFAINKELMICTFKSILNCRGPPSELFSIVHHPLNTNSTFNFIFILLTLLLSASLYILKSSDNLSLYCILSNPYPRCNIHKDAPVYLLRLIALLHLFIKSNYRLFILSYNSIKQELIITIGDMLCSRI